VEIRTLSYSSKLILSVHRVGEGGIITVLCVIHPYHSFVETQPVGLQVDAERNEKKERRSFLWKKWKLHVNYYCCEVPHPDFSTPHSCSTGQLVCGRPRSQKPLHGDLGLNQRDGDSSQSQSIITSEKFDQTDTMYSMFVSPLSALAKLRICHLHTHTAIRLCPATICTLGLALKTFL
jgi:hypothetical protein